MSDESMFNEFDLFGLALEELEEPHPGDDAGTAHNGPNFDKDTSFAEDDLF